MALWYWHLKKHRCKAAPQLLLDTGCCENPANLGCDDAKHGAADAPCQLTFLDSAVGALNRGFFVQRPMLFEQRPAGSAAGQVFNDGLKPIKGILGELRGDGIGLAG